MLATARDDGLIPTNPAAGVRLFVVEQQNTDGTAKVKAWSPSELDALVDALPERWRLFACFLAETGLRISEAVELRYSDLDLGERTLRVERRYYRGTVAPPKSRFGRRTLRLSEPLAREQWTARKQTRARDRDLVYTSGGERLQSRQLADDVFRPAAVSAGVPWLGWHGFRHTCATSMFREGSNAVQVQRWLGHHSPAFTLATYVHLLPEDLPEPPTIGARALASVRLECDSNATQTARNATNSTSLETQALQGQPS
jgi:integrase